MTQLELNLPPMHSISLYCRLEGKLARWDAYCASVPEALAAVREEVAQYKGKRSAVLALIRVPVVNTSTE